MTIHKIYSWVQEDDYNSIAGPDWPSWDLFSLGQNVQDFVYKEIDQMLSADTEFKNSAFCVLPFYGREYPNNTVCCLLPNGTDIEEVKHKMLSGERPRACSKCWDLEDSGALSDRLLKNKTLDYYTNISLENLYEDCINGKNKIIAYKIDTNNICNGTCVTCNSRSSSAWAQLERRNNLIPHKTWRIESTKTHNWIDFKNATSIIFRGGEPFLSDANFYILEKLLENNNADCFISFVTNGSFKLSVEQKKLINQFSKKNFCFSIDGVGPVFEYMRYPLLWKDIIENIEFCRKENIDISISYTLSNLNILYHDETISWFHDNQLPFIINPVSVPNYFSPGVFPNSLKSVIANEIKDRCAVDLVLQDISDADQLFERCKNEISKQDAWKNISITKYLPKFAALFYG